jgi:RHS repeat-associated protein
VTISDQNGAVLDSSDYGNEFFFQGRTFDKESGLYYFRNRYYSPELGRFISRDPLGYDAGDINLYRFVGNDPYGGLDPMGLYHVYIMLGSVSGSWSTPNGAALYRADVIFAFAKAKTILEGKNYTVKLDYRMSANSLESAMKDPEVEIIGIHTHAGSNSTNSNSQMRMSNPYYPTAQGAILSQNRMKLQNMKRTDLSRAAIFGCKTEGKGWEDFFGPNFLTYDRIFESTEFEDEFFKWINSIPTRGLGK